MQLWRLKERIENKTIKIGGYHKFMVFDPKKREVQALSFSDRVFQHLLCDKVLMPYFEHKLIYDNAACRKNKGTHFAQNRFSGFLRDHYKKYGSKGYILKFDIKGYFNSIHHKVLKEKLKDFPDKDVKELLYYIIDSYENEPERGIPMGNQSSQWFALYYLDRLDRTIKEKLHIKYYIRYMDDGVLLHQDKEYLKKCLAIIKEQAAKDKLEFNKKTQIFPLCQGVDFLGFHFYLTDTGKVIKKLRTSNKKRFKRRLKRFEKQYAKGQISYEEIKRSLASYQGHLKHGHTYKLRKHVISNIKFKQKSNKNETENSF